MTPRRRSPDVPPVPRPPRRPCIRAALVAAVLLAVPLAAAAQGGDAEALRRRIEGERQELRRLEEARTEREAEQARRAAEAERLGAAANEANRQLVETAARVQAYEGALSAIETVPSELLQPVRARALAPVCGSTAGRRVLWGLILACLTPFLIPSAAWAAGGVLSSCARSATTRSRARCAASTADSSRMT